MEALHAGLIHGTIDFFFNFFMMMMVERRAAAQASAKRERRRTGMSAANVGASISYSVNYDILNFVGILIRFEIMRKK